MGSTFPAAGPWRGPVGATVAGAGTAAPEAQDGSEPLWSVRLDTDTGRSMTVALGEVQGGALACCAADLIVVPGRRIAEGPALSPTARSLG